MTRWRRLLAGSGRFPEDFFTSLLSEGMTLLEEDLRVTITYRGLRTARRRPAWRKVSTFGAIAVTEQRVVVWGARGKQIDVPFEDPRFKALQIRVDHPEHVLIAFDASAFDRSNPGRVELRLRSRRPEVIAHAVRAGALV
jgi:hypothetical protein